MRAVRRHTDCKWVLLYIERWLQAPVCMPDGTLVSREKGTPQGRWLAHCWPISFSTMRSIGGCRDITQTFLSSVMPTTSSVTIVARPMHACCATHWRNGFRGASSNGTHRRPGLCTANTRTGETVTRKGDSTSWGIRFDPERRGADRELSSSASARRSAVKQLQRCVNKCAAGDYHRNDLALIDVVEQIRPVLLGWVRYYGRYRPSALREALRTLDHFLVRWARRKYKRLRTHKTRAWAWLRRLRTRQPTLFPHWELAAAVGR
jgi:RNA-directed DNA polymerase